MGLPSYRWHHSLLTGALADRLEDAKILAENPRLYVKEALNNGDWNWQLLQSLLPSAFSSAIHH
jgi:hypothetical protein